MSLITIQYEKCRQCYACVRICPVQAIRIDPVNDFPEVIHNRCIGCGSCYTVCNSEAISYLDGKEQTKRLLKSGEKVAAVVLLCISGEFTDIRDYRKFVEMIRRLGFSYVIDASMGVDVVAHRYAQLFENYKGKKYIMANCPAVTSYVEKFHPELVENLAPIVSPMIASAKIIHKKYGNDTRVIYIGPCVAAKKEANRYANTDGQIDAVLTFSELRQLFAESGIKEGMLEYSNFDPPYGYKGSLYPISRGILQAGEIQDDSLTGKVITTDGPQSMLKAINEFEQRPENINRHFNLFYDDGCLMGPGTTKGGKRYLRQTLIGSYTNKRIQLLNKREWAKDLKQFSELNLSTSFQSDDQRLQQPSESRIKEILISLGVHNPSESAGCGACGHASCKDFAVSVAQGLTQSEMCINYSFHNRKESTKEIVLLKNQIFNTQQALDETQHSYELEKERAIEARQTVDTMLQKLPVSLVIVNDKLHIQQASNSFIAMLGEDAREISEVIPGLVGADLKKLLPAQVINLFSFVTQSGDDISNRDIQLIDNKLFNISIFTIKKNKSVGAVIRDLQAPDVNREEVLKRITDAIDRNLEMVQKIGFLLGEGAAETEQTLHSIIELYKKGK